MTEHKPLSSMKKAEVVAYARDLEQQLKETRWALIAAKHDLENAEEKVDADTVWEEGYREGIEIAAEDVATALDLMELDGELDWELRYKIVGKIREFLETVTVSAHEAVQ